MINATLKDTWNQKKTSIYWNTVFFFFSLSFSRTPRRLSCTVIWLLTFPAMPTCSELPSVENVNAPKWLLINYCGECFTAVTLANTSSGSSCRCFLSVQYIRWLVWTHKHLQEGGTRQTTMNTNTLRSALEGFCCFSFPFSSLFFFWGMGVWNIWGFVTGSCLNWRLFSIRDLFTNAARAVSAKCLVFTAIMHSFQRQFPHDFDVSETKNTFSTLFILSLPVCLFWWGKKGHKFCASMQKW